MLIYTVQPGDTVTRIAMRLGSTVALIVAANQLSDPNQIVPGQKLLIPVLTGTVVRVQPGDSLFLIARRFDLPVEVIAAANSLEPPYEIHPGQILQIPVTLVNTNGCMAFQSTRANGVWDTWLRSPNRADVQRLTFNLGGPATVPKWSPDGNLIALVSPGGTLYVVEVVTGQARMLLSGLDEFADFAWAPDSQHLVVEVQDQLIQIEVNTAATQFVTNGTAPAFLPAGETLIFTRATNNRQQLLAINLDGSGQRLIATINGDAPISQIDVDPSGQLAAFVQSGPEQSIVLIVELASGQVFATPSTNIKRDFFPRWSPDGQTLAYNSTVMQDTGLTG
ncbi:MAG: LysM peptidoglycan-binding domain-containing protein, partial [Firmicutes bacterium]|nr:LysM peptidoglycan-binding domain-containing protein [Bacillota bacterium]